MTSTLTPEIERALNGLAAGEWRERKASVEMLTELVARTPADSDWLPVVRERLLAGLLAPDQVDGRAASHEVLATIGRSCLPAVRSRLDASPDPATARRLVDLLGEIGDHDDVARLVAIVEDADADANLRASALTGLGHIGGPRAEACLVGRLRDPSEFLRVYALDALRDAGAVVDVADLEPLAAEALTRKGAATLLGATARIEALPILLGLLGDPTLGVRAAAAGAIVALDEGLAARGKPHFVAAALQRADDGGRQAVRDLLHHDDRSVRTAAIALATMAKDVGALPAVLTVMEDPLLHERALAMVAGLGADAAAELGRIGGHVDAVDREHLLRLVGALGPDLVTAELQDLLVASLEDVDSVAAEAAAESLGYVGGRPCLGGLYRAMATPGPLGDIAADALAAVLMRVTPGRYEDLDLIVGAAWPQSGAIAQNLCRVVGKLQAAKYVVQLVAVLGSPDVGVRIAAAVALGHLPGEHEGISALSLCLADEEPQVRAAACRSLGHLRAASACQSLLGATSDPSPLVRAAAVAALVSLDNPVTLARMRAIIAEDPVPTVVVQAIAGLGRSALDQDLTMLMSLCTSEDHEVVKAAARALESFAAHRATASLLGLLEHDRWDVRWAAAEVLARREDATAVGPLRQLSLREPDPTVRQAIAAALASLGEAKAGGTSP